jgi:hypothetical protein
MANPEPNRIATPVTRRFRVAIADVNAGLVLLPAIRTSPIASSMPSRSRSAAPPAR